MVKNLNLTFFKVDFSNHEKNSKVEKILKGSQDSVLSPQWKFKLWAGKFAWGVKAKQFGALSTNFLRSKDCWQHPAMFCLYTFPAHILNFHWRWRWWGWIQAIFVSLFFFTLCPSLTFLRGMIFWISRKKALFWICTARGQEMAGANLPYWYVFKYKITGRIH